MQINGPSGINGPGQINQSMKANSSQTAANNANLNPVDQLDLSSQAQMIDSLSNVSGIRAERVAEIKSQIANGVYETPEKIEIAVERLLDEMA